MQSKGARALVLCDFSVVGRSKNLLFEERVFCYRVQKYAMQRHCYPFTQRSLTNSRSLSGTVQTGWRILRLFNTERRWGFKNIHYTNNQRLKMSF